MPVHLQLCKMSFTSIVHQICAFNIAFTRIGRNTIQNALKNGATAETFSYYSNDVSSIKQKVESEWISWKVQKHRIYLFI